MAPIKKDTPLRSPLVSAFNNIVNITRSKSQMRSTQRSYSEFLRFMTNEVKNIEAIKLPDEKKIKKLSNINVSSTFGSAGSLLSGLASGALDAAGLVGNLFGGGGRGGKQTKPKPKAGKPIPKGTKLRIPGIRGLPILSAALAGLDFAQGISTGESTGKAAAGAAGSAAGAAGGALAGAALAGVIGQTLVPVPGLGFVLGAAVGSLGSFAGGYLADRAYEKATGEGNVKEKTKERLKQQEQKQKLEAAAKTSVTLPQVLDKFDSVVTQFERASQNIALGTPEISDEWEMGETEEDRIDYRPDDVEEFIPTGTGEEVFPLVGGKPNFTMGGGLFNAPRDGGTRSHNAQDIGVDPNTPVVSSRPGRVINIYPRYGSAGGAVIVRYDNGQQGLYGHVDPSVKIGDKVQAGQKIAKVTPDGRNTHLHYMRKDTRGNYIDPLPILRQSKSGVPIIKGEKQESKKDLQQQSKFGRDTGDSMVSQKGQMMPTASKPQTTRTSPTPEMVKNFEMAWQYKNNPLARRQIESTWEKMSPEQKQQAMTWAESKGYDWKEMNLPTPVAQTQVQSVPQQLTTPTQIEQYPDYNLPQSSVTLMPIIMSGGGGSQQRPMVIAGGGGGGTTIMPPIPEGQVLNSLFKTLLLTNLSNS